MWFLVALRYFVMSSKFSQVKGAVEVEMMAVKDHLQTDISDSDGSVCSATTAVAHQDERRDISPLRDLLRGGIKVSETNIDPQESYGIPEELKTYLDFKTVSSKSPLTWWDQNSDRLPILKHLASKYLCIPATSASSERSFSSAGSTASKLRSRLTGSHIESLNVMHCNKVIL